MRVTRLVALVSLLTVLGAPAPAPGQAAAAGFSEIGRVLLDSALLKDIFDLIVSHSKTRHDIHCRLHDVYQSLLDIRQTRGAVGVSLQARLDELARNPNAPTDSVATKKLIHDIDREEHALADFRDTLEGVDVDLDQQSPELSKKLPRFVPGGGQAMILQSARDQINLSNLDTLRAVKEGLRPEHSKIGGVFEGFERPHQKAIPEDGRS